MRKGERKNCKAMYFGIIALITLLPQFLYGQKLAINHGPYVQYVACQETTIMWSTSKKCISWVECYKDDGTGFYSKEREKVFAQDNGIKTVGFLHKVTLKNLKPSTRYAYRIFSKEVFENGYYGKTKASNVYTQKPFYFSTQEEDPEEVSCVILSDMHQNKSKVGALLNSVVWDNAEFVVFNGDFVNKFNRESDLYDGILDTCVQVFAKEKPLYIVRGNHDTRGKRAINLKDYFHFPENKYYYTYHYGNTAFIVLDSGEDKPDSDIAYNELADFDHYRNEQAKWLADVLKSEEIKNAKHVIVFMHIPPSTKIGHIGWHGCVDVKKKFIPILNQAKIDLLVCGHTHSYSFTPKSNQYNFPVLISDATSLIDLTINNTGIKIKRVNTDSVVISEMFLKKFDKEKSNH